MRVSVSAIMVLAIAAGTGAVRTMIPTTSFDSQADFDADWDYNYPWGTDHNGGARMDKNQVKFSDGQLTLTAKKVTGQKDAYHGGHNIKINYLSGAISAKERFNVSRGGGYDFLGEFRATTTKGTWPAFWLTAVDGWPPEIEVGFEPRYIKGGTPCPWDEKMPNHHVLVRTNFLQYVNFFGLRRTRSEIISFESCNRRNNTQQYGRVERLREDLVQYLQHLVDPVLERRDVCKSRRVPFDQVRAA
ncbi:hypothetical protein F4780DRAFT_555447 [Xylariomycetidae sp. FL0641]|nr:hypothetical protein F4780DRAFT_555447 [Xylariomycetidae sp. FL0641]